MKPLHQANTTSSGSEATLAHVETYQTTYEAALPALYRDGQLIKMPAVSRDPRDPMNLSTKRKIIAIVCLSFFGALIASAEIILGAALPVFALEYAGIPPSLLEQLTTVSGGFPVGSNPLTSLELIGGPPIFQIFLLATLPVLMIGVANLFLVPLAITLGRRPVVIATGIMAIVGAAWAGASTSLGSHIGARCIQAIGAGSVESLIPFIIQDLVHVHERNTWISGAFACQGLIIIALGFSAPYMIINISWRWLYHITAILAGFFLIGVIAFLPETRWQRTKAEMNGIPRDDANVTYQPRTLAYDLRLFSGTSVRKGVEAFIDTMKTFFYPSICFVTFLNASIIASTFASAFTACPALLTQPWSWPFEHIGLSLIAILIGAILVAIITGKVADAAANAVAKRRGARVPENQLINLALPWLCSFIGTLIFGLAGNDQTHYPWIAFLISMSMMTFGFLGTSSISTVYVLESYPYMAGPALVNVASFRWIIAFLLTLWASDWIVDLGYKNTFLIYVCLIAFFGLFIPIAWWYGPSWRKRFPGRQPDSDDSVIPAAVSGTESIEPKEEKEIENDAFVYFPPSKC